MITTLFETLRALPKPVLLNVGDLLRLRGKGGTVALFACLMCTHPFAAELPTLKDWMSTNTNWSSRPSEQSYFFARCYALHTAFGTALLSAKKDSLARMIFDGSRDYGVVSHLLGGKAKMTEQFLSERDRALSAAYAKKLASNKQHTNDYINDELQWEVDVCRHQMKQLTDAIK